MSTNLFAKIKIITLDKERCKEQKTKAKLPVEFIRYKCEIT